MLSDRREDGILVQRCRSKNSELRVRRKFVVAVVFSLGVAADFFKKKKDLINI